MTSESWASIAARSKSSSQKQSTSLKVQYSFTRTANVKKSDGIPRHKEVTPDPEDDFTMVNSDTYATQQQMKEKQRQRNLIHSQINKENVREKSESIADTDKTDKYWIRLQSLSLGKNIDTNSNIIPLQLNQNEFLLAAYDIIYKYCITDDLWSVFYQCESSVFSMCLAAQKLYLLTRNGIEIYNNKTETTDTFYDKGLGGNGTVIMIQSQLHIITIYYGIDTHFIFNEKERSLIEVAKIPQKELSFFDMIYDNDFFDGISDYKMIHIQSINKLLALGVNDCRIYSIDTQKWTGCSVKNYHRGISEFGFVKHMKEQFVIIIGGSINVLVEDYGHFLYSESGKSDLINILNLKSGTLMKSKLPAPKRSNFVATTMMRSQNDLLVHGYIRTNCCKDIFIPIDILQFINKFISITYVHLIAENGSHWKIPIEQLLCDFI